MKEATPELGRWARRDPLGYVDGMSLYEYVASKPTRASDPYGRDCPGCDPPFGTTNPCKLRCCSKHDACFDQHNCNAIWPPNISRQLDCLGCDIEVAGCFLACKINKKNEKNRPPCYCHKKHCYYTPPWLEDGKSDPRGCEWGDSAQECCCNEPDCDNEDETDQTGYRLCDDLIFWPTFKYWSSGDLIGKR